MIDHIFDEALTVAGKVGTLSSSAVLSLVCFYFGWKNYKIDERNNAESDKRTELRIKDAEANLLIAKAMEKQSDVLERIQVVLDERLPGR